MLAFFIFLKISKNIQNKKKKLFIFARSKYEPVV